MAAPGSTSLIDAVDDANEPVGAVARGDVFRLKANFRTVHVLVFNQAGDLLLQRLSATRERHPLMWGSSVAGYLHAGEDYLAAGQRRLREELGLRTELTQLGVTTMADDGVTKFIGVFETRADHAAIADAAHIAEIRFCPPREVVPSSAEGSAEFTASLLHVLRFWRDRQATARA